MNVLHIFANSYVNREIALFDAGSTGTRLTIYSFIDHTLDTVNQFKAPCALDQLTGSEIEMCLISIAKQANLSTATPIGLYATAGLRRASKEARESVLQSIHQGLIMYNLKEAKIITGDEEALYTLKAFEYLNPSLEDFVILDLGGKSIQIISRNGSHIGLGTARIGLVDAKSDKLVRNNRLKEIDRIKDPVNQNFFLLSGFVEILDRFGERTNLRTIKVYFKNYCSSGIADVEYCSQLNIVVQILNRLGLPEFKQLIIVRSIDGVDLTWSLGKALEMNTSIPIEGKEFNKVYGIKKVKERNRQT